MSWPKACVPGCWRRVTSRKRFTWLAVSSPIWTRASICCSPSLFVLPIGFSPIILARRFAWRYGWVLAGVVLSHEGERRLRLASFWGTPKRTCLSVICSSVVGQLRWKEHIKKHKKFLIFLINKLVSYLCAKLETMTELLSILYKLRIFTSDELSEALKDKVKSVEALLARYKQQGWIVAIRRNTYCMKDIASGLPVCNK